MLYNSGQMTVAGVGMTIQSVTGPTVKVMQLADIPFELLDDDLAVMPHLPDTGLMGDKFALAYIFPVVDGGGNSANNRTDVAFKLNLDHTSTPALDAQLQMSGALESDGNRLDSYWVSYIMTAYQPLPNPANGRADNDPDSENQIGGVTSGFRTGSFLFFETHEDRSRESGWTSNQTQLVEQRVVIHEIGHQFALPDRSGGGGLMGSDIFDVSRDINFIADDLKLLRDRVRSPGR
jgi:hypothetical protein